MRTIFTLVLTLLALTAAHAHESHRHESPESSPDTVHDDVDRDDVHALIRQFRASGDDRRLDRAWELLQPELRADPPSVETLYTAAVIAQAGHHFGRALAFTDDVLASHRDHEPTWLLRASIHLVRGEAELAAHACNRLRRVPVLAIVTCHARVALIRGDTGVGLERLARMLELRELQVEPALRAWSLSVAGDLAGAAGALDDAQRYYEQSLRLSDSAQVRAALADVQIARNDLDGAALTVADNQTSLALHVRHLIVGTRLGRSLTLEVFAADRRFSRWIADGDWLHAREMARFYLDVVERPKLARDLAAVNLKYQREPEDLLLARRTGVQDLDGHGLIPATVAQLRRHH